MSSGQYPWSFLGMTPFRCNASSLYVQHNFQGKLLRQWQGSPGHSASARLTCIISPVFKAKSTVLHSGVGPVFMGLAMMPILHLGVSLVFGAWPRYQCYTSESVRSSEKSTVSLRNATATHDLFICFASSSIVVVRI